MSCAAPPPIPPAIIARARPQASVVQPPRVTVRQAPRKPRRVAELCRALPLPPAAVGPLQPVMLAESMPAGGGTAPSFAALIEAPTLVVSPVPIARKAPESGLVWHVPPPPQWAPWITPPLPAVSEPPTWLLVGLGVLAVGWLWARTVNKAA